MIQNLRLKEHKALRTGELRNLGKVSVVCGTNNSGKTTILERIASGINVELGIAIDIEKEVEAIHEVFEKLETVIHVSGVKVRLFTIFDRSTDLHQALRTTFDEYPILYEDDVKDLPEKFLNNVFAITKSPANPPVQAYDLKRLYRADNFAQIVRGELKQLFDDFFEDRFPGELGPEKVVLITPKRRINSSAGIGIASTVEPDGTGLIQRLFYLKSTLPKTRGRKFFELYWNAFQEVSGLKFDIEIDEPSQTLRLHFSPLDSDEWRFADDCGLGLRELMVILYFGLEGQHRFVLLEEPENHLHPEMQRRLLSYLKEKSPEKKQFLISTHSSVFLDNLFVDRIFQTSLDNGLIKIYDATTKAKILNDLGYSVSDNLVSDLVLVVEGSGDKATLEVLLRRLGLLTQYTIRFWLLNGDAMSNIDLASLADRFSLRVLLDRDPQSETARKPFLKQCKSLDIPVTILKRYSIENYFSLDSYRESFGSRIPKKLTELSEDEPVWSQLGSLKKADIKRGARKFAERTPIDEIMETDLGHFLTSVSADLAGDKRSRS